MALTEQAQTPGPETAPVTACNLACLFCTRRTGPLMKRLGRDLTLFGGGEPLLHPNLFRLMAQEKATGQKLILETNGLLLAYGRHVQALKPLLPLDLRLLLPAATPESFDTLTQRPGSFGIWLKAVQSLQRHNIPYSLTLPLLTDHAQHLDQLGDFLHTHGLHPQGVVLSLQSGQAQALAQSALALFTRLQPLEISVRFHETTPLPPCVFEKPEQALWLSVTQGGGPVQGQGVKHHRCLDCVLDHACPGVTPTLQNARESLRPLKKRTLIADFQLEPFFEREFQENLLTFDVIELGGETKPIHALLRVTFQCNHHCRFCWVNPNLALPATELLKEKIREAKNRSVPSITLTGGEPTLRQNLPELVAFARAQGLRVHLQTHAMALGAGGLAQTLKDAGVELAYVSLHGHTPELSDSLTGYPGGFEKTVAGLGALLAADVRVIVSHVLWPGNAPHLPDFARFIHQQAPRATVMLSMAQAVNDAMAPRDIVPSFEELAGPVTTFFNEAARLRLNVIGPNGECGIPPCVLEGNLRFYPHMPPLPQGEHPDFTKAPFCHECRFDNVCWGPRTRYVERHGFAGLKPIPGTPVTPCTSPPPQPLTV